MLRRIILPLLLVASLLMWTAAWAEGNHPAGCAGHKAKGCAKSCSPEMMKKCGAASTEGMKEVPHDNTVLANARMENDGKTYYTDPVCGMKAELGQKAFLTVYNEKRWFFCNSACLDKFEKDPKSYTKPVSTPAAK